METEKACFPGLFLLENRFWRRMAGKRAGALSCQQSRTGLYKVPFDPDVECFAKSAFIKSSDLVIARIH